jgi:hypothetical protein
MAVGSGVIPKLSLPAIPKGCQGRGEGKNADTPTIGEHKINMAAGVGKMMRKFLSLLV